MIQERRILAIVLPELLCELAASELAASELAASELATSEPLARALHGPVAVVLTESVSDCLDAKMRLDAVNRAARERGVRPRHSIAEATAIVATLKIARLPRSRVSAALKQIAEMALGFGSPVSFEAIDTVWVDISGSGHLFGTEQALAHELVSSVRALGHTARVSLANGPWLARALARHGSFDESGVCRVAPSQTVAAVGMLPILALPIDAEDAAWFARLGLLTIDDLRKLPSSALAARLMHLPQLHLRGRLFDESKSAHAAGIELCPILDLIRGDDGSVLIPYVPEETPSEELSWDEPLSHVEPLLFVLKGLSRRLGARLEGRGQAALDLLLTIHHDRSIAALQSAATGEEIPLNNEIRVRLATPLVHAEDLERVVRCRLQREVLAAPAVGLSLRATSVTVAQCWQLGLSAELGLEANVSSDPRSVALLASELAADIGSDRVGVLVSSDSHLLEKSSRLSPTSEPVSGMTRDAVTRDAVARLPTRLLEHPLELTTPLDKNELCLVHERAFVIESLRFEERLEAVEWWERQSVFRDYYRVWLAAVEGHRSTREGMEVLAYFDRNTGKSYVHAVYD